MYQIAAKINDYAAKITGNATFTDSADPANTGASDQDNIIPGGLTDDITITDAFELHADDTFDVIEVVLVDNNGETTSDTIDAAEGDVTISDGTDDVDLTALPLKVQLVVKTTLAPAGKTVNFWITEE